MADERSAATMIQEIEFAPDSPLERTGFSNFPYAGAMNLVFAPVVPSTTISSVKILTAWLEPSASSPARPLTAKCQRDDPKSGPGRSQTRVLAGLAWGGTHRPVRSKALLAPFSSEEMTLLACERAGRKREE